MPQVIPTTPEALLQLFSEYGLAPEHQPAGQQAQLILELLDLYGRRGLLPDGRPAPLCEICPRSRICWADESPNSRRVGLDAWGEDGGVCLPWVGREYKRGGVCVLAMNFNIGPDAWTGLTIAYEIVRDQYVPGLRGGHRAPGGSRFSSGLARTAAGLLDVLDGKPVTDREPSELAGTYARIAQLQAVKCIPRRARSAPSTAMWRECPPFLLADELDILKPSVLLALGGDAQRVVENLHRYDPRSGPPPSIGTVARPDYTLTAYGVAHPAWSGARESETRLLRQLRQANSPKHPPNETP